MVRRITREQLVGKQRENEHFVLLDVSPLEAYQKHHLPKAIHFPPEQATTLAASYFKGRDEVVIYGEDTSHLEACESAALQLAQMGYSDLYIYAEGKKDWIDSGMAIDAIFIPPGQAEIVKSKPINAPTALDQVPPRVA